MKSQTKQVIMRTRIKKQKIRNYIYQTHLTMMSPLKDSFMVITTISRF